MADFALASWNVLLVPKGTPTEIVEVLRRETATALKDQKLRELYSAQGVEMPAVADTRVFLMRERESFGRVVRELGISMD